MEKIRPILLVLFTAFLVGCARQTEKIKTNAQYASWYKPKPGISWQYQLSGEINTKYDADIYDIDLFDAPQKIIDELHEKDVKVICYFSAGTWEKNRRDASDFPIEILGNTLLDWPDEKWLDISNYQKFSNIIIKRLNTAVEKKCDGIEPDNIDGYQNKSGFNLTYNDQLEYNKWLSKEAHKRNLAIALKNDLDQVDDLVNYFDLIINEQCFQYNECNKLYPFIKENKAVLGVEYVLSINNFCKEANKLNFSWLKMDYKLDGKRISC